MKTRNVRTKQWRKHYRVIRALDSRAFRNHFNSLALKSKPGRYGVNIPVSGGLIRHNNKMLLKGRQFWLGSHW